MNQRSPLYQAGTILQSLGVIIIGVIALALMFVLVKGCVSAY